MGFYIRKSVKAGPFRFNLSKSGVGVSVGVPGFRVGTGPHGNYVRMDTRGLYYRTSVRSAASDDLRPRAAPMPLWEPLDAGTVALEDVTGATTVDMRPTGGGEIVQQLNAAARYTRVAWWVVLIVVIVGAASLPYGIIVWLLAVPACWWLFLRDASMTKVVVFYDVNDDAAHRFDALVSDWIRFADATKLWRTTASGRVQTLHQHKRNAGASNIVEKADATATLAGPKHLSTNVAIPTIVAGRSSLHFLPDRVLVREGNVYTDVSYAHLNARGQQQRFIESPGVMPRDSIKVGETWQYVNKGGGPDRRFSNNPVLPIMLYSNLDLTSAQGLSWRVQCSRPDAAPALEAALDRLAELARWL